MCVYFATRYFERLRGLLGRERSPVVIVLSPCKSIHTFGMKEAIDVAFIDQNGVVLSSFQNVQPGKRLRNSKAHTTLERFCQETPWLTEGETISIWGLTPL